MLKSIIGVLLLVAFCTAEAPTLFRSNGRRPNLLFLARQQQKAPLAPAPTGYPAAGVTPEIPFDLPSSTVKPDVTYLPPDNTYGPPSTPPPPPPPQRKPDATYGPPAPHSTYGPPDNTYLPPEDSITERDVPQEVDENQEELEVEGEEQQPTVPEPDIQDEPKEQADEPVGEEDEEILVTYADDGPVIAVSNAFDAQGIQGETEVINAQKPARLVFQRFPQGKRGAPADAPVPARLIKMRPMASAKLRQPQRNQLQPQPQPQSFAFVSQYTAW